MLASNLETSIDALYERFLGRIDDSHIRQAPASRIGTSCDATHHDAIPTDLRRNTSKHAYGRLGSEFTNGTEFLVVRIVGERNRSESERHAG